jgi:hypothetical protein
VIESAKGLPSAGPLRSRTRIAWYTREKSGYVATLRG